MKRQVLLLSVKLSHISWSDKKPLTFDDLQVVSLHCRHGTSFSLSHSESLLPLDLHKSIKKTNTIIAQTHTHTGDTRFQMTKHNSFGVSTK